MFVTVNGAKLFVDIEGAGLVASGAAMREKPTLVLLHGGPGFDHSIYKPAFSQLSDICQIVYYDHRGNGRSGGEPDDWNLAQWGDDVKGLCDALGIERPIVYGASFGGFVAQSYATRHPAHAAKLILTSTAAKMDYDSIVDEFGRLGGPEVRETARAYWLNPTLEGRLDYLRFCLPHYQRRPMASEVVSRAVMRHDVALHFNGPQREQGRMDFRAALQRVRCPVLVMAGSEDPITPMAANEIVAACLPDHLVRFERFADCGHGVVGDQPERAFALLREFITG